MKTLLTADDVIDTMFRGPSKAARWAGVSDNAVCHWRHRGVPPSLHLRLVIEAQRRGFLIGPDVFGLEPDDWDALRGIISNSAEPKQLPAAAE